MRLLRALKLRHVGAGGKDDAQLFLVAGFLVVERDALANLGRGDPHDGIGGCIVIGGLVKNLDAESALLELIGLPGEGLFHDVAQKCRKAAAVTEEGIGEEPFELFCGSGFFFVGKTLRPRARGGQHICGLWPKPSTTFTSIATRFKGGASETVHGVNQTNETTCSILYLLRTAQFTAKSLSAVCSDFYKA